MIELHLIGYTEDGDHLVLDLDADGEGRYLLVVDPDLLATLEAVREERLAAGKPVDERPEPEPALPTEEPEPALPMEEPEPALPMEEPEAVLPPAVHHEPFVPSRPERAENGWGPSGTGPEPAVEPETVAPVPVAPEPAEALAAHPAPTDPDADHADPDPADPDPADVALEEPSPATAVRSRLTPAEIQARLRAGRSVRAVAKEADVEREWVERWHDPIRAERERVLADARSRRVDHPKARPLGAAVDRSLAERGVSPTQARWRVVRRDDGRWRVSVRFEERGRPRTATWLLDPDAERLRAQSRLATELSAPGRRTSRR